MIERTFTDAFSKEWIRNNINDSTKNLAPFGRTFNLPHIPLFLHYNRGTPTPA